MFPVFALNEVFFKIISSERSERARAKMGCIERYFMLLLSIYSMRMKLGYKNFNLTLQYNFIIIEIEF